MYIKWFSLANSNKIKILTDTDTASYLKLTRVHEKINYINF